MMMFRVIPWCFHHIRKHATSLPGATPKASPKRCQSASMKMCDACREQKPKVLFRLVAGVISSVCKECELVSCAACNTKVLATTFSKVQLKNYFAQGNPVVCDSCAVLGCTARDLQLYACTRQTCGKQLGHKKFNSKQLKNFKMRGGVLVCIACLDFDAAQNAADIARERKLRAQAATSKRKGCTCFRRLGHTEKCPMHIKYAGEETYPWCDVMTRRDSDWLQSRK